MASDLTNRITMENALLFQQEASTPYEKALARYLVAAMQREENLQKLFEALMQIPDDVTMAEVRQTMKEALASSEYRDNDDT